MPLVAARLLAAAATTTLVATAAACGGSARSAPPPATRTRPVPPLLTHTIPPPRAVKHVGGGTLGTQTSLGGESLPFSGQYFRVVDLWGAKRHGVYIDVYAGAPAAHPGRGGLIVDWTNPKIGLPSPKSGLYLAPRGVGPLTLTDVRGDVLYVRFVGGRGTFDLGTRRFTISRG